MNPILVKKVKSSLNEHYYTMNDSWLQDCIEFYLSDHNNPTHDEITAFVMNQWTLYDLREINYENGCLPTILPNKKITRLPGTYIIQVDKMYDISTSKYKQFEKIRNLLDVNVEVTENENKTQELKPWEPKTKRMFLFFLTDGVQDVLAIEFKTIRFLKELLPGFKILIKGPVICRRGVLLLEENNIVEVGGEVESLLIVNAVENILARALFFDENPDPYNDKNRPKQSTESIQNIAQADNDFDLDSEAIDQIDKQISQQNTNVSKISTTSNLNNKHNHTPSSSEFNYSYQTPRTSHQTHQSNASSARNQLSNSGSTSNNDRNEKQNDNEKVIFDFDDEGDVIMEMVDHVEFKTPSTSIASTVQNKFVTKETPASKSKDDEFPSDGEVYDLTNSPSPLFSSSKPIPQSITKTHSQRKDFSGSIASSYKNASKIASQNKNNVVATPSVSEIDNFDFNDIDIDLDNFDDYLDVSKKNNLKSSTQVPASTSQKAKSQTTEYLLSKFNENSTSSSDATCFENEFEEDFYQSCKKKLLSAQISSQTPTNSLPQSKNEEPESRCTSSQVNINSTGKLSDKLKLENKNKDYYNTNKKVYTDTTTDHSSFQTNKNSVTKNTFEDQNNYENLEADFKNDFHIDFEARMEIDSKAVVQDILKNTSKLDRDEHTGYSITKSPDPVDKNSDAKSSGSKRPASLVSPSTSDRSKLRCVASTPKDKTNSRKITDFFEKPKPRLMNDLLPLYEAISMVLKRLQETDKKIRSVVRGKVVNVVKLNLIKGTNGAYFHLEGTITDGTANLDVVFSSEVLEQIVGCSTQEFMLKRKRAKTDPKIKDELRDDLKKAQNILRVLDGLMEIELQKNEKTTIIAVKPLSKEERQRVEDRLQKFKAEKR